MQQKPVPYRQTLGNALRNAEHLRVMMQPRNRVLLANFWQFANEYWGMVQGYVDRGATPVRQANFYVYQLYHEHFGDTLIEADVQCGTWDFPGAAGVAPAHGKPSTFRLHEANLLPRDYTWTARPPEAGATQTVEGKIVRVEFSGNDVNYYAAALVLPAAPGMGYRLTGYAKTEGLNDARGVGFQVGDARGWTATKSAALEGDVRGTADWTEVVVDYVTLLDATRIDILARRVSGSGPVSGKAWFRLESLQAFEPENAGAVADLGVNATKRKDGTLTAMIVNRNLERAVPVSITVTALPARAGAARAWLLSGPSPTATNLTAPNTITVREAPVVVRDGAYALEMPPCSLAAVEIAP